MLLGQHHERHPEYEVQHLHRGCEFRSRRRDPVSGQSKCAYGVCIPYILIFTHYQAQCAWMESEDLGHPKRSSLQARLVESLLPMASTFDDFHP